MKQLLVLLSLAIISISANAAYTEENAVYSHCGGVEQGTNFHYKMYLIWHRDGSNAHDVMIFAKRNPFSGMDDNKIENGKTAPIFSAKGLVPDFITGGVKLQKLNTFVMEKKTVGEDDMNLQNGDTAIDSYAVVADVDLYFRNKWHHIKMGCR